MANAVPHVLSTISFILTVQPFVSIHGLSVSVTIHLFLLRTGWILCDAYKLELS